MIPGFSCHGHGEISARRRAREEVPDNYCHLSSRFFCLLVLLCFAVIRGASCAIARLAKRTRQWATGGGVGGWSLELWEMGSSWPSYRLISWKLIMQDFHIQVWWSGWFCAPFLWGENFVHSDFGRSFILASLVFCRHYFRGINELGLRGVSRGQL